MDHKLEDRKGVLKKIIKNKKNSFEYVEGIRTRDINEVFRIFDDSVRNDEEGIIIKIADSKYQPHVRSPDWIKLKSDYIEGLSDTFDVIILGGYFGEGKARIGFGGGGNKGSDFTDFITHFLLGISININRNDP